jgi:5'-nucleotidase
VALGTHNWEKVDIVLSGINLGSNLGNSMWHSGTVAAAKQACLLGLRGIALSVPARAEDPARADEPDFEALKPSIAKVLEILLHDENLTLVNVNFPDIQPKGLRWTRQSVRHYDGKIVPGEDPRGRKHYWFSVIPMEESETGTDRWAVEQGYVSITPLRLDLTNEKELAAAAARHPLD